MTKESSGYGDSGQTVFDKAFAEGRPGDKAWGGGEQEEFDHISRMGSSR